MFLISFPALVEKGTAEGKRPSLQVGGTLACGPWQQ